MDSDQRSGERVKREEVKEDQSEVDTHSHIHKFVYVYQ